MFPTRIRHSVLLLQRGRKILATEARTCSYLTLPTFSPLYCIVLYRIVSYRIAGIAKGFYQFTGLIEELDRVIWAGKCINEKVGPRA